MGSAGRLRIHAHKCCGKSHSAAPNIAPKCPDLGVTTGTRLVRPKGPRPAGDSPMKPLARDNTDEKGRITYPSPAEGGDHVSPPRPPRS